jgi:hypothetical protein
MRNVKSYVEWTIDKSITIPQFQLYTCTIISSDHRVSRCSAMNIWRCPRREEVILEVVMYNTRTRFHVSSHHNTAGTPGFQLRLR